MRNKLKSYVFVFMFLILSLALKHMSILQTHTQTHNYTSNITQSIYERRLNQLNIKKFNQSNASILLNNETNSNVKVTRVSKYVTRYVSANRLMAREKPSTNSKVLGILKLNKKIYCASYNDNWCIFHYNGKDCYISSKYISKNKTELPKGKTFQVPNNGGFMSYMPYTLSSGRSIFSSSSKQRQLQNIAYTGTYGIRQVNGRYCVAIGSYFTSDIGVYFDIVLNNNTVIPCVLADAKANCDTDSSNIITTHDGSVAEFIIDNSALNSNARKFGNIAMCCDEWQSSIKNIVVYDKNCLK